MHRPITPERLGQIGPTLRPDACHARKCGTARLHSGAEIPFVVEAWATCTKPEQKSDRHHAGIRLLLNRTPSAANILAASFSDQFGFQGCGLRRHIFGVRGGNYDIALSVIAPHIELATDGKEPVLGPFSEAIVAVIKKAGNAAHRAMERPERGHSIRDAAWFVMEDAYAVASGEGRYPANARQIMYAARPAILELTGRDALDDKYFTQTLLPDYVEEHPDETAGWDVVFDARGHFVEPHTTRSVPLGTLDVRQYLGDRPEPERPASVDPGSMLRTVGPANRYSTILFIEKEGFDPLLAAARIAERFDVAIMSTKGMSVTAARLLLDRLAPPRGRRSRFLRNHRVELNAMTADVFVAFLERKLTELGVRKLVPDEQVMEGHARQVLKRALANRRLDAVRAEIEAEAAAIVLPADFRARVAAMLAQEPELPWDIAVARVVSPGP